MLLEEQINISFGRTNVNVGATTLQCSSSVPSVLDNVRKVIQMPATIMEKSECCRIQCEAVFRIFADSQLAIYPAVLHLKQNDIYLPTRSCQF